jgi:hypothetical protein
MTSEGVKVFALFAVFGSGIAIPVSIAWFDHRTRTRALDVLRVYAERGEEAPASVLQALTAVSGWAHKAPGERRPQTRGGHLAHAAGSTGLAAGLAGLAWWRFSTSGEMTPLVIVLSLAAVFFAASIAPRLVGAYYARE